MFRCLKGLAAPIAALALCVIAPGANAEPIVSYATTGLFGAGTTGGTATPDTRASTASLKIENTELTFHAGGTHTVDSAEFTSLGNIRTALVNFGFFSLSSTDPNGVSTKERYRSYDGASFTLTVEQFLPVVPAGSELGQFDTKRIRGTVWYVEDNNPATELTGSYLSIEFADPLQFTIPNAEFGKDSVVYTINPKTRIDIPTGATSGQQFAIGGTVTAAAVPLPGVAVAGLALMGGVAFVRRLRRPAQAA